MSLTIETVNAEEARKFWERQNSAPIFMHPHVLEPMCNQVDWWLSFWSGQPVCLWPVCHKHDGTHHPPDLSAYVGPMWDDSLLERKASRWWTITHQVQEELLRLLVGRYRNFMFELPPGTFDIRVFQWFARENAASVRVLIEPRHTALLQRPEAVSTASVIESFGTNRRYDISRVKKLNYIECTDLFPLDLFALYADALGRKFARDVAERRRSEVLSLISSATNGFGRIIAYRDQCGVPAGFTLSLENRRTSQLIAIASSHSARTHGLQTLLILEEIKRSFDRGAAKYDFLGANSRVGAEEKHRYGAWPAIFFRIYVDHV